VVLDRHVLALNVAGFIDAIDTGYRLVGNLATKYDRAAREWIARNKAKLLELWQLLQTGKNAETVAIELRGAS
jgi:hypothetical protein